MTTSREQFMAALVETITKSVWEYERDSRAARREHARIAGVEPDPEDALRLKDLFNRQWVCSRSERVPCSAAGAHVLDGCGWRWRASMIPEDFEKIADLRLVQD